MYKEMRSSKTMKRKWKDTNASRGPKPESAQNDGDENFSESSEEDYDDYDRQMLAYDL